MERTQTIETEGVSKSHGTGQKKWRRRMWVDKEDTSSSSVMESYKPVGGEQSGNLQGANENMYALGDDPKWGSKRSVEAQDMVLIQAPQKKLRGPDTEENCQGRVAELWRKRNYWKGVG
ncbi:hypothetical protein D8674_011790 [Pyrus ussuriensis x Pyrus communis]|uniref:Uncharacterized protein n=1 Tax=Pyrus ussuriensis x Pyrus communis TaxID=2448454 RepID=A0A5N5G5B4_9ROSA|nr:hypothetical protein D8674_011790 [Pyrus ussuriensis x Pyrus communis]